MEKKVMVWKPNSSVSAGGDLFFHPLTGITLTIHTAIESDPASSAIEISNSLDDSVSDTVTGSMVFGKLLMNFESGLAPITIYDCKPQIGYYIKEDSLKHTYHHFRNYKAKLALLQKHIDTSLTEIRFKSITFTLDRSGIWILGNPSNAGKPYNFNHPDFCGKIYVAGDMANNRPLNGVGWFELRFIVAQPIEKIITWVEIFQSLVTEIVDTPVNILNLYGTTTKDEQVEVLYKRRNVDSGEDRSYRFKSHAALPEEKNSPLSIPIHERMNFSLDEIPKEIFCTMLKNSKENLYLLNSLANPYFFPINQEERYTKVYKACERLSRKLRKQNTSDGINCSICKQPLLRKKCQQCKQQARGTNCLCEVMKKSGIIDHIEQKRIWTSKEIKQWSNMVRLLRNDIQHDNQSKIRNDEDAIDNLCLSLESIIMAYLSENRMKIEFFQEMLDTIDKYPLTSDGSKWDESK